MKQIHYDHVPKPKPTKSWGEQLADELERRYSLRMLDEAIEILKARRAQLEQPAPADAECKLGEMLAQKPNPSHIPEGLEGASYLSGSSPRELPEVPTLAELGISKKESAEATPPKRRGRKPLSPEEKERRLQQKLNSPRVLALTEALAGMAAPRQDKTDGLDSKGSLRSDD